MARIETIAITGRTRRPLRRKLNPVWWAMNDEEPWPPDWYLPGRGLVRRTVSWYLRNPLQNFGHYVIGVHDRNYQVRGPSPVMTHMWEDASPPRTGWKWSVIRLGWLRLPFISYSGRILLYAGWQPNGFFGFKLNIKHSPVQLW
jgi:hypothetical protein